MVSIEDNKKRFDELIKKAELNEDECEFLGDCYFSGKVVEKDLNKSIEYHKRGGGYYNTWKIAECYFEMNTKETVAEGIKYLIEANSMSPNSAICYEIFLRFISLDDYENAFYWLDNTFYNVPDCFENSEEEENHLLLLAHIKLYGLGINKDEKEAFRLLKEYSDSDSTGRIYYYLGLWSEYGVGTEKNTNQAIKYYEQSFYDMRSTERITFVQFDGYSCEYGFLELFYELCEKGFYAAMKYWKQLNGKEHPLYERLLRMNEEDGEDEEEIEYKKSVNGDKK